jgi:hypothetical protein
MEESMVLISAPRRLGLIVSLIAFSDVATHAASIRFGYGGVITSADHSTGVLPGMRFSGTFTYDSAAKPSGELRIEGSNQYIYGRSENFPGSVADGSGLALQAGGQTVLANPGGVQVAVTEIENPGQYGYRDAGGNPAGPSTTVTISNENIDGGPLRVSLSLSNPTRSVFGSLAPPTALSLTDFSQAQLSVTELTNPGSKSLYTGTIDSLQEIPAPEPALTTLLCLAALGWFTRSHHRQGHSRGSPASSQVVSTRP